MVSKKSFTLLVDTGTIPFFAVIPIISDGDCREVLSLENRGVLGEIQKWLPDRMRCSKQPRPQGAFSFR